MTGDQVSIGSEINLLTSFEIFITSLYYWFCFQESSVSFICHRVLEFIINARDKIG